MAPAPGVPELAEIREGVLRIVAEVAGETLPRLPDDTPILDLGVSSLALVDGMRRIYERFGVLISIRRVLEGHATLGGIAALIEQELRAPRAQVREEPVRAVARPEIGARLLEVPFAPSQRHVGFLARYSSGAAAAYNEALALGFDAPLDTAALQAALDLVSARYEALRTSLSPDSDTLVVHAASGVPLAVSQIPAAHRHERLEENARRPFIHGERLFRAELLRESGGQDVLLLVGHALVVDHEALHVVVDELASSYTALSAQEQPAPRFPALQWSDYLALGLAPAARQARTDAEIFWKQALSSPVVPLALPADRPRPPAKGYGGQALTQPLDPDLVAGIERWGRSRDFSVPDVVLGAYAVLLSRLSGQNEVVIGVRSAPLYLEEGERAAAQTRDMLPIRLSVDPRQSFGDLVHRTCAATGEAGAHRHLSLAEIIQLANLPRDQSRSALFVAAFQHRHQPEPPAFGTLRARHAEAPACGARYDVDLAVESGADGTALVWQFSTELFDPGTIARWTQGLAALLRRAVDDPQAACGSLPVMSETERHTLLVEWNRTEQDYPRERTVLDLVVEQAGLQPHAPAVRSRDEEWSYERLLGRVDALARQLVRAGVAAGDRVGVLLERSPDLIAALLAAWRAGALYVPLDPRFPSRRLAYMLEDAAVRTCITSRPLAALLPQDLAHRAVRVEDVEPRADGVEAAAAEAGRSAYVIYTSGSTGQPKGVEVGHEGLVNCLESFRASIGFGPGDVLLAITTPSFDIAAMELLMPLLAGGVSDIAPDGAIADGIALAELLDARRPHVLQATPSVWKTILAAGWRGDPQLCICAAGESLERDLAEQLLSRGRALWNLYGPTETTVYSAVCKVTSAPGAPVPIGRPLANTELYVLDGQRQPVPLGATGELYIAGAGVAAGYWHRPEATLERFVPHPFRPGERLYRTGDLVRYQSDGTLLCLGRLDDQVKIHGVRVELGEVEAALRSLSGVRDAAVTVWRDARGDAQLVAHVVAAEPAAPSATEIRAQLREQLPEALVPPYLLFTDAFPMTVSGKVRRADLPAPTISAGTTGAPIEPPATATERQLAEAWARVLGIDAAGIGRESHFMDLGGHSLLLTPLMIDVRRLFDVSVSLREFFDAPTIRTFGRVIEDRRRVAPTGAPAAGTTTAVRRRHWGRERMATLLREAELPTSIAPARGLTYQPVDRIGTVLLTGATGFLGAHVLAEILQSTSADVYCLVRNRLGQDSLERIERQMRTYALWRDDDTWRSGWRSRLHVVEGDVTLPRLGIEDATYETLARSVDAVLHGAAHVNFIYPYEALRATNVLGTHEIIRFAFHARIKPVHHLSTAAIWPMGARRTFYEKDPIEHGELLNLGYDEAKWVGERCLLFAADRGLPVARYRPGEVGGDSLTGICVTDHFLIASIKGFLQFGAFPALDIEIDVAPVDYVARAMTHLAFHGNPLGRAFHLTNPNRLHMSQALAFLRRQGYTFEELRFEDLRDRLLSRADFGANALFAYQAVLEEMDDVSLQLPTYDTREVERELRGSNIGCPPADERLFGVYLDYLRTIGFMPAPEGVPAGDHA